MRRNIWISGGALMLLAGCASTLAPVLPDGKNRVVDIVNTTNAPLQFYAVNAERRAAFSGRSFEQDVSANYYLTVNFDDDSGACLYNLFAVLANGQTMQAPQFNTCAEVSWVVKP